MTTAVIREATIGDSSVIANYIREFATEIGVTSGADQESIELSLFGTESLVSLLIIEFNGEIAGFSSYCYRTSTFRCKNFIYIEDVYIDVRFRKNGLARLVFNFYLDLAISNGTPRLEWIAAPSAIEFYRQLGASNWEGAVVQFIEPAMKEQA